MALGWPSGLAPKVAQESSLQWWLKSLPFYVLEKLLMMVKVPPKILSAMLDFVLLFGIQLMSTLLQRMHRDARFFFPLKENSSSSFLCSFI
jgi:hypothetical protein